MASSAEENALRTPLLSVANIEPTTIAPGFSSVAVLDSSLNPGPSAYSKSHDDEEWISERLEQESAPPASTLVSSVIIILIISTFVKEWDSAIIYLTAPIMASEFNALHDSSWLITGFGLSQVAAMPLYGKLSDILGRKTMLLVACSMYATGSLLVGVGTSMWTLILGRVIAGPGWGGLTILVSVVITDLVPLKDVGSWISHINIVATTSRAIASPLAGWLADTIGWRWCYLMQIPPIVLAIVLLSSDTHIRPAQPSSDGPSTNRLARVDFPGALLIACSILGFLVPLSIGGERAPWSSPLIVGLFIVAIAITTLFILVEACVAKEPILPLSLFANRDVCLSYLIFPFQCAAQTGLLLYIPLYFRLSGGASNTAAGAHMVPAVVGNATGGILAGLFIRRTGRYRLVVILATMASSTGYLLCTIRWKGNTGWLETLYILPGGLAMGAMNSALFVGVQAAIDPEHAAVAASTLYLCMSSGFVASMAGMGAILQGQVRSGLDHRLDKLGFGVDARQRIVKEAVSDAGFAERASPLVAEAVVGSYVDGLTATHAVSFALAIIALVGGLLLREHKLS